MSNHSNLPSRWRGGRAVQLGYGRTQATSPPPSGWGSLCDPRSQAREFLDAQPLGELAARATPLSAPSGRRRQSSGSARPTALYRAREGECTHLCAMCAGMCAGTFAYYFNEKSLSAHIAHIFLTHCYRKKTAPNNCPIEDVMRSDVCSVCNTKFSLVSQRKVLHT